MCDLRNYNIKNGEVKFAAFYVSQTRKKFSQIFQKNKKALDKREKIVYTVYTIYKQYQQIQNIIAANATGIPRTPRGYDNKRIADLTALPRSAGKAHKDNAYDKQRFDRRFSKI